MSDHMPINAVFEISVVRKGAKKDSAARAPKLNNNNNKQALALLRVADKSTATRSRAWAYRAKGYGSGALDSVGGAGNCGSKQGTTAHF